MRSLTYQGITWHDDPSPSEATYEKLQKKYDFHELDIADCLSEHERPKIEEYPDYLFIVFHIPYQQKRTGRIIKEELNVFIGNDYIITLHKGKIDVLDKLWSTIKTSTPERKDTLGQGTGYFLYLLMYRLFNGVYPLVDGIHKHVRTIENRLFETNADTRVLQDIMKLKRNTISIRSILLPQRSVIATLEHKSRKFVSEDLALYFDDVLDDIERQWSLLDTAKEMIDVLQDTHESWISHRTNNIIRVLTIFSVTMLPLTLITGLYGMNVQLPYANSPIAFSAIVSVMLILLLGMFIYFLVRKWI